MALIIDPKPYLLYETVAMVFSHLNDVSVLEMRDKMSKKFRGCYDDTWYRKLGRLQEIRDDCCRDLDPEAETVQHFFRPMSTGCSSRHIFLAEVMTTSFMMFQQPDLDGEAQALKEYWLQLQQTGYLLSEGGTGGLSFKRLEPGESCLKLNQQIYGLKYPSELRLELMNTFLNFECEIDLLVELLRPYAVRLEACLQAEPWLMDSTVAYWREVFKTVMPEDHIGREEAFRADFPSGFPELKERRICFLLMSCMKIYYSAHKGDKEPGHGIFIFGSAILKESRARLGGDNVDWVLSTLRSISDRNKFELLRKLSREESYCQKLAEELGCHPGNVSRNLTTLWKEGFLIRKEGESRIYYKTDSERIASFFQEIQGLLTGKVSCD